MPRLELTTVIRAPRERVFDLARSIDLHTHSMGKSRESAVAGVTSGLIGPGQWVTWRARHFGLWLTATSEIVAFDRPASFRDSMVDGPFKRFDHDHLFEDRPDGGTTMVDVFDYTSPLGPLGRLADALFVERHMRDLLAGRNAIVKTVAEGDDWRRYVAV